VIGVKYVAMEVVSGLNRRRRPDRRLGHAGEGRGHAGKLDRPLSGRGAGAARDPSPRTRRRAQARL